MTEYVRRFAGLSRADVAEAGGKGANLGELTTAELPVPPGFVVTAAGYLASLDSVEVRAARAAIAAAERRVLLEAARDASSSAGSASGTKVVVGGPDHSQASSRTDQAR